MVPNTAADFEEQQQPQALARLRTLAQYYLTSIKLLIFLRLLLWYVRRCMVVCQPQFEMVNRRQELSDCYAARMVCASPQLIARGPRA